MIGILLGVVAAITILGAIGILGALIEMTRSQRY